jgi:hypothetical protein
MTVKITPAEYSATVEKIAKINARAAKKGFTGRITLDAERLEVTREISAGLNVTEVFYEVSIGGEAPSYNGWTLAAVLDFDPEAGLIVNTAPGVESINREGLQAGWCGHCETIRNRRKAYLVRNAETGQEIQVGSSCIKDFLGWSGGIVWVSESDVEHEVSGGWGYSEPRYTVDTVLAVAWACIKVGGWVPASAGFGQSTTKDRTLLVLNPPTRLGDRDKAFIEDVKALASTENIQARAAEVRAFILSDDFAGDSEYVQNLKNLMSADSVTSRHFGLAVSAPQAYARHQERTLVKATKDALPASEYLGSVGDKKVEFTGMITHIRYLEGVYGTTVLYVIRNQSTGVEVKWFASREALGDKQGVEVSIVGTVKAHEEYQGRKTTVLTRCKAL